MVNWPDEPRSNIAAREWGTWWPIIAGGRGFADCTVAEDSITRVVVTTSSIVSFARKDRGNYDASAPAVRRAKHDLNGVHDILRSHLDDVSQTQRDITLEAYFEEQSPDKIVGRRGSSLNDRDNHRKAPCSRLRDSITSVVDSCADRYLRAWYDRVEEMNEQHAASQRRRAARNRENRSSFGGDCSNFGGDPSNFEGDASNSRSDAEKIGHAPGDSVLVTTES